MASTAGKYLRRKEKTGRLCPFGLVPMFFLLTEVFAFRYLSVQDQGTDLTLWPLAFGCLWTVILSGILGILPRKVGRLCFGILAAGSLVYSAGQTGYYQLFSEMMWISEFRYASEGSDYFDILLSYPADWFVWVAVLLGLAIALVWKYPGCKAHWSLRTAGVILAGVAGVWAFLLPQTVFEQDADIRYAKSDYGRMQSAEAAYENMFNTRRLYQVCGLYQTAAKDIYGHYIYPLTPGYALEREADTDRINAYFETRPRKQANSMTGILKDKNIVLVLMESMDDWMVGEHTPTISRLMTGGINFTNFYTPPYGGIRTFNTEFCINTGSYLSSQKGYAFDYVTNGFGQSLASQLTQEGYSAKTFHYNDPNFYSRGVFSEAMGYEQYVYYADYLTEHTAKEKTKLLYDDLLLFTEPRLREAFFRDAEKTLNFVITRSAHLSYKYNEVLSHWGLKRYPEYFGMTGNEETDCALLKARLVDDLFRQLLVELEKEGKLEDTVIIGITDHYTYGYKNEKTLLELSGVESKLLLEKTPCFIWSADLEPMIVDKVLNTADFLPTVLNMLGLKPEYDYIGHDAFDEAYEGYVLFADGSWITADSAYDASGKKLLMLSDTQNAVTKERAETMGQLTEEFTAINNLILESDYYKEE